MKIAILGTRGIPARYGGFETLAEELATGLVKDFAMDVTVYCRSGYYQERHPLYRNVRCIYLPSPRIKGFESILHTFLSALHARVKGYDLLFITDPANGPVGALLRLFGSKVVIHTDGLGWKRRKWGPWSRRYYKWVEWICARFVGTIVTDNPAMRDYYLTQYNADSTYIPYGAHNQAGIDNRVLDELHLRSRSYLLVVARLEKENNTDLIIREFVSSHCEMPLLIVGDSPYGKEYLMNLQQSGSERVYFAGRIDDQAKLNSLYRNAYLYVHGHEVGGTNPSLLRAMDAGAAPLVIDVPFNRAVIGDCGYVFTSEEGNLAAILRELALQSDDVKRTGERAKLLAEREFQWESVVSRYAKLFESVIHKE